MARRFQLESIGAIVTACACVSLLALAPVVARGGDAGTIRWKSVPAAQLHIDGKTPLTWNVYQPDKKKESNLILILLGRRFLALDTKAKLVYSVVPADLRAVDKDYESDDLMQPSRVLASTEWVVRDVGPAESIKFTLGDYGRAMEIQLPHMPDLRRGVY